MATEGEEKLWDGAGADTACGYDEWVALHGANSVRYLGGNAIHVEMPEDIRAYAHGQKPETD